MNAADTARAVQTALVVGALGLDQIAVGQLLLSQPLVGGAILGWSAGNLGGGLFAGAFFQFLCLTDLPVGVTIPPDTALAGLLGVATFLTLGCPVGWSDQSLLGLLAVGFLPVSLAARALDVRVRRANRFWVRLTEGLLGRGRYRLAQAAAVGGVLPFFLRAFLIALALLVAVSLWGGSGLDRAAAAAPAFDLCARAVPLLGLAALVIQRRRPGWIFAVTFGVAAGVLVARLTV